MGYEIDSMEGIMLSAEILSELNQKQKNMAGTNKAKQQERRSRAPKRKHR